MPTIRPLKQRLKHSDILGDWIAKDLLEGGCNIRSAEASVDGDVKPIMVYTRVLNQGPRGVLSPIDKMPDGDMRISISLLLRAGCSAELVASKANYVASSTDFCLRLIQTTGIVN